MRCILTRLGQAVAVSLIPRGLRSDLQEPERKEGLVLYAADLVMTTQSIAYYKIMG